MNLIRSLPRRIGRTAAVGCLGLLLATTVARADWHGGRWSCCWRGGVFIGVAPPVYLPPPVYYPPPSYVAPYGYAVPGY